MTSEISINGIKDSIAYCGLVCAFCSESKCNTCESSIVQSSICSQFNSEISKCTGCRTKSDECSTKECCKSKNIDGCWECKSFPCGSDMQKSPRVRAFVRCAKEDGIENLAMYLLRNAESGIQYHKADGNRGDYDILDNEELILMLLRAGKI